ncbi:unnamed protein product [Gordionus sp. m RMFG-2023]
MGWMTWERFRCSIDCSIFKDNCLNENLIMSMANQLVKLGFKDVGYEYLIIDDCWSSKERDSNGELQADPIRFPNGIKYIADYIHSKGLKFGIYSDFGISTCQKYPGSEFYIKTDAETFAKWNVDYVKMDGCYADPGQMNDGYPEFSKWLNKTGRPIVFSCSWPDYQSDSARANYSFISNYCNLWRNYADIQDSWNSVQSIIKFYGDNQDTLIPAAGPGQWNDPDMLIIGDFGLSYEQSKTQMAFWCLLSAPLIMSNDLRRLDDKLLKILLNPIAIGINQDPLGLQGARMLQDHNLEVWLKPIKPLSPTNNYLDHVAIIIYNSGDSDRPNGYRMLNIFEDSNRYIALNPYTGAINQNKFKLDHDYQILFPDSNVTFFLPPGGVTFITLHAITTKEFLSNIVFKFISSGINQ